MQANQQGGPPFHCEIADMKMLFDAERWLWSRQYETQVIHSSGKHEKVFLLEKKD